MITCSGCYKQIRLFFFFKGVDTGLTNSGPEKLEMLVIVMMSFLVDFGQTTVLQQCKYKI